MRCLHACDEDNQGNIADLQPLLTWDACYSSIVLRFSSCGVFAQARTCRLENTTVFPCTTTSSYTIALTGHGLHHCPTKIRKHTPPPAAPPLSSTRLLRGGSFRRVERSHGAQSGGADASNTIPAGRADVFRLGICFAVRVLRGVFACVNGTRSLGLRLTTGWGAATSEGEQSPCQTTIASGLRTVWCTSRVAFKKVPFSIGRSAPTWESPGFTLVCSSPVFRKC